MARPQLIDDRQLLDRLSCVFRNVGYAGSSLADLSEAAGLKRASLYHRFPGGKQQMAEEVLASAIGWCEQNILAPLRAQRPVPERIAFVAGQLSNFYAGGKLSCLLNMLSAPLNEPGPYSDTIKAAFEAFIKAFEVLAIDAGHTPGIARQMACRAVMMLQGSLVLSRGLGSAEHFQNWIDGLKDDFAPVNPNEGDKAK